MPTNEACALAAELTRLADEADAKVAKKAAENDRRQKHRDCEIAAGQMVVFKSL